MEREVVRNAIQIHASADVMNYATSADFKVGVKALDDAVEMMVYGGIGDAFDGIEAKSVVQFLSDHKGKPVNVRINSPGGLAYDGVSIYNALVQHGSPIDVLIEGIAASSASIIAMSGDKIRIAENASIMIHRAWGIGVGNSSVMADLGEFLDKLDSQIAATYAARTGRNAKKMMDLMIGKVDGTTMNAQEAVDSGFADQIVKLKRKPKDEAGVRQQEHLAPEAAARFKAMVSARVRVLEIDGDSA